jgi:hypothetical protein
MARSSRFFRLASRRVPPLVAAGFLGCAPARAPLADRSSEAEPRALAPLVCLRAAPPGGDTYARLRAALGERALELPDDFHSPPLPHILEAEDPELDHAFVFRLHRDVDRDPMGLERTDRQRVEIKVYDRSAEELKGYEHTAFTYHFQFRVGSELPLTRRFTHVFQLKAAQSPDDQHPVLTFTAAHARGRDVLQVRQSDSTEDTLLAEVDWSSVQGRWIDAVVGARYSDHGTLRLKLTRRDGVELASVTKEDVDLWRGGGFVRPKWGFYRSLADRALLTNAEDSVRFANIGIGRGLGHAVACR